MLKFVIVQLARRNTKEIKDSSVIFFCQDHFDEDPRKRMSDASTSRHVFVKKQRTQLIQECQDTLMQEVLSEPGPSSTQPTTTPVQEVVLMTTGCDSGLGWAIAARTAREGLVTVAGMYNGVDTKAAEGLKKLCALPYSLDVTNPESVTLFRDYVKCLLNDNPNYKLHAIVNNAGVMTIGDYEWQTPSMIESSINVNLLGTMRVTTAFLPDLRKSALESAGSSKPRIINVASHCGLHPLPGFGAYSASKAGVLALTKALRMEHLRHGLSVVAFVPGGFVTSSNIIANQETHGNDMFEHLNDEQKSFYGKRIRTLSNYLQSAASHNASFDSLKDEIIIETYVKALTDDNPKDLYKVESWRYMFYYSLFKLPLPEATHYWLVKQFLAFPK